MSMRKILNGIGVEIGKLALLLVAMFSWMIVLMFVVQISGLRARMYGMGEESAMLAAIVSFIIVGTLTMWTYRRATHKLGWPAW